MGLLTDVVPLVPFLLPPSAGAIGWSLLGPERSGYLNQLLRLGLGGAQGPIDVHSWYGLIFVCTTCQVPYVFMIVSAGLRNTDASQRRTTSCSQRPMRPATRSPS
ncbi:hypothetical protein Nocox_20785 [Nonomuraea coxensis DSM 45129]|uniref:Uncharacterized protein n=1 Tax=Nonomuraea coxensis DSM 45129 TaxID=1122611 RepID=A0ABX8U280_9ACTN|nr:hypothetical protein [Nonomuraea coxensis]QYC41765.1 hypothetical protein Nocox_20785 [Nonomuraea coxensis DSM 45129]